MDRDVSEIVTSSECYPELLNVWLTLEMSNS